MSHRLAIFLLGGWLAASATAPAENAPRAAHASDAATCSEAAATAGWQVPGVFSDEGQPTFDRLIATLSASRVVLLGETHDRYDHHLTQLEVVCRLHRAGRPLAIGFEAFQQPFQPVLDDYLAGRIDEADMLRRTEYFSRWQYDFRLYAPLLRFARAERIDLIALNLPSEITRKVGRSGLASLDVNERAQVPAMIDRSDVAYRDRLRGIFELHPGSEDQSFEHFLEVQLLWDEGMAEAAARYLERHPQTMLVIIAGAGHVEHGAGIPKRLERRIGGDAITVVLRGEDPALAGSADVRLHTGPIELPSPGMLGIFLEPSGDGIEVGGFTDNSAAEAVGMETGDRLESVDGRPVSSLADVRIAMLEKRPGDVVPVVVERTDGDQPRSLQRFEVELR